MIITVVDIDILIETYLNFSRHLDVQKHFFLFKLRQAKYCLDEFRSELLICHYIAIFHNKREALAQIVHLQCICTRESRVEEVVESV
jgi:hypothetical protein